jgi:hypothetical protein
MKLNRPVQMVGYHMDDPGRNFEGNPTPNYISDEGAKALLLDAISANPGQKNAIKKVYNKYFG